MLVWSGWSARDVWSFVEVLSVYLFSPLSLGPTGLLPLCLCSLAHPDRSLLTMVVSIYFMRLYFFTVLISSVLPLNRTVVFWGDFSVGGKVCCFLSSFHI